MLHKYLFQKNKELFVRKACDQELFTEANAVLQQLFAMEPVEFVIEQA